jgi:hypothetical protein
MLTNSGLKLAILEAEQRRYQSRTYTEPLDDESVHVQEYCSIACSEIDKDKFLSDLVTYSESVGEHYKYLVPEQVSEDDFRSRYLYRCDVINIMREWASQPNRGSLQRSISTSMTNATRMPSRGQVQRSTSNSWNIMPSNEEVKTGSASSTRRSIFSQERDETPRRLFNWSQQKLQQSSRNLEALQLLEAARGDSDEYTVDNVCFHGNRRVARGA